MKSWLDWETNLEKKILWELSLVVPIYPKNLPNCEARNLVEPSPMAVLCRHLPFQDLALSLWNVLDLACIPELGVGGQSSTFLILKGSGLSYSLYLLSCPFLSLLLVAEWGYNKHLLKRPCAGYCRKLKNFYLHFDI